MFYYRTIIIIIFINFLSANLPYAYRLPNTVGINEREFKPGWPDPSIIDLRDGYEGRIFSGTGGGPGMIDYLNYNLSAPTSDFLYQIIMIKANWY